MFAVLLGLLGCGEGMTGPLLSAEDAQERKAALYALGPEGVAAEFDTLLAMAEHDPEPTVRRLALGLLGPTGDPRAVPLLKRTLEDWDDRSAQLTAITALANLSHPDACEALVSAYVVWLTPRDAVAVAIRDALVSSGSVCKASLRAHKPERPDRVDPILVEISRLH